MSRERRPRMTKRTAHGLFFIWSEASEYVSDKISEHEDGAAEFTDEEIAGMVDALEWIRSRAHYCPERFGSTREALDGD